MTSKQLTKQIGELQGRRAELSSALKQAEAVHVECQQILVKAFTADAQEKAASAFASYSSLKAALESVEHELETKQAQREETELSESQQSTRDRLKAALREVREVEDIYRLSRVKSDQALVEHVNEQVNAHRRWKRLQNEITALHKDLGESSPRSFQIVCPEPLHFGHIVDLAAQQLLDQLSRPTKEELRAKNRERSAREAAAAQRRNLGHLQYPSGWNRPPHPEPQVTPIIHGRMRIINDTGEDAA